MPKLTEAQKKATLKLFNKRKKKILEATDNGRCWWLYQMLTSTKRFKANDGR